VKLDHEDVMLDDVFGGFLWLTASRMMNFGMASRDPTFTQKERAEAL
jgi:hypothetical protein